MALKLYLKDPGSIRMTLIEQGMLDYQFAEKAGISPTTLSHMLQRRKASALRTAVKVANALGVKPGDIFEYAEEIER